jgi:hypothetical protein
MVGVDSSTSKPHSFVNSDPIIGMLFLRIEKFLYEAGTMRYGDEHRVI